ETGNVKAFWNFHNYTMLEQETVARTWDYEDLAQAASAYDLDESLIEKIKNGELEDKGVEVGEANAKVLKKKVGQVSSPIVLVDDQKLESKTGKDGMPQSWVPDVVKNYISTAWRPFSRPPPPPIWWVVFRWGIFKSAPRGYGAVGSAPHWQCGGQGFESP